jgi:two-component system, NarL family, nitrate/nitrite response regulator NarL
MPPRVLLVDDNESFLADARRLLEAEGVPVLGVASTGAEAASLSASLAPDVALVDVMLAAESGFEVAQQIVDRAPGTDVILISTHAEDDFIELISASPARGFVQKSELSAAAIRRCSVRRNRGK